MTHTYIPQERKYLKANIPKITTLVIEIEGTLTDNRTLIDNQGHKIFSINQHDILSLKTWLQNNYKLTLLARTNLSGAAKWCKQNNFPFLAHQGAKNLTLQAIIFENKILPKNICYLGSNLEDLLPMMIASITACPIDSNPWVTNTAHIVLKNKSGQGVAKELITYLLNKKYLLYLK